MKKCSKCKETFPFTNFHKNRSKKDGYGTRCKQCAIAERVQYYKNNKQYFNEHKEKRRKMLLEFIKDIRKANSCVNCGETRWYVLDFHHRKSSTKKEAIANMVSNGRGKDTIQAEIDKCDILCANCHREVHYRLKLALAK